MKINLILLLLFIGVTSQAQITESEGYKPVTYYKKFGSTKKVSKYKAKFKNEIIELDNGRTKGKYTEIKSGIIRWVRYFDESNPVGVWEEFDEDGVLINSRDLDAIKYCKSKLSSNDLSKEDSTTMIDPYFVGGESQMYSFLGKELNYPAYAYEHNMTLRVRVQFVIEKNGEVTGSCIELGDEKASNKLLEYEAIRVISKMPNWIPGELNGENVRVRFSLPIKFALH